MMALFYIQGLLAAGYSESAFEPRSCVVVPHLPYGAVEAILCEER